MLSRVADALYWMSRYVERVENAARVLEVTSRSLIDLQEVDPEGAAAEWEGARTALGLPEATIEQAALDAHLVGSVASSLGRARENARHIREVISAEMWNYLNEAYWALMETQATKRRHEVLSNTLVNVIRASLLWGGATDATMGRGEGWLFIRLGQFVERTDRTIRLFNVRWRALASRNGDRAGSTGENVAWLTLLRCCCASEEYRKRYPTRIDADNVVEFLVFDRAFPRTVQYGVSVAAEFARRLQELTGERGRATARAFGRLAARLEYAEASEVLTMGPDRFLDDVHRELDEATLALQQSYFLH